MKKLTFIVCLLCTALMITTCYFNASYATEETTTSATTSEVNIPSDENIELSAKVVKRVNTNDKKKLKQLISQCQARKDNATEMKKAAIALGYDSDHPVIQLAKDEWNNANADKKYYQKKLNKVLEQEKEAAWKKKASKYPEASYIWRYLKNKGYSDYVAAGILGNIMAEVGGQTLSLNCCVGENGYYGMCQWSSAKTFGLSLENQCDYLYNTMKYEFNTYGNKYYSGFNYSNFKNLKSSQDAALAFAKCYERCGSGSYSQRQSNAIVAYNYFKGF